MSRKIIIAGAQLGAIHTTSTRSEVLDRMLALMNAAYERHAKLIVYPELAFTVFFPRTLFLNRQELETYFERNVDGDPTKSPGMKPLFDRARKYQMDVSVGYAECDTSDDTTSEQGHKHYNAAIYYSAAADKVIARYRKVHLPGTFEPFANPNATNQFEKRYFLPGNLGFQAFRAPGLVHGALKKNSDASSIKAASSGLSSSEPNTDPDSTHGLGDPIVGMIICNDRRWAEAWRCYGLQGVEILIDGYNTTAWAPDLLGTNTKLTTPEMAKQEALFHSKLSIQAGTYQNACWSINVAKCGVEDGKFPLIAGSCIVDPDGVVVVEAETEQDELIVAECDLEACRRGKNKVFAFERHRRTEHYERIVKQTGVEEPELLD